jgi:hypothetical protein
MWEPLVPISGRRGEFGKQKRQKWKAAKELESLKGEQHLCHNNQSVRESGEHVYLAE